LIPTQIAGTVRALVTKRRSNATQLAFALVLATFFTLVRWSIDRGALGLQFASCFPAILLAAILLRPAFVILVAFGSVAFAQWLLVGRPWFDPPDLAHVAVLGFFLLSVALILVIGVSLRASLRELDELARQQHVLNAELREKTQSSLGLALSISRSLPEPKNVAQFRRDFDGRLAVLASASEVLNDESLLDRKLPDFLEAALRPIASAGRITLSGKECILPRTGMAPALMFLHQLVKRGATEGALAHPAGSVELSWSIDDDGMLHLVWQEFDPRPDASEPFDRTILEGITGVAAFDQKHDRNGLRCEIVLKGKAKLVNAG
jgi:two-component sensor histidine kinase